MTTLAIMQPYFAPYAGYFRLIERADIFVAFDCVQFPRRGYVHRNRLRTGAGTLDWATLPMAKAPQEALIHDLRFTTDAPARWSQLAARYGALSLLHGCGPPAAGARAVDWILESLALSCARLALDFAPVRSSTLNIAPELRGVDRVIAICQRLGAQTYLNAPGGRSLYGAEPFEAAGLSLRFLPDWTGRNDSVLQYIADEGAEAVCAALRRDGGRPLAA